MFAHDCDLSEMEFKTSQGINILTGDIAEYVWTPAMIETQLDLVEDEQMIKLIKLLLT